MQGKETVVFISNLSSAAVESVKEELNKDNSFLGVTVRMDSLKAFGKAPVAKVKRFLILYVWKPISYILHKISNKIKTVQNPVLYNPFGKTKVQNMLFRYAPSAIVVTDPNVLFAIKETAKKAERNVSFIVMGEGPGLDYDLIDNDVKHYFVDNIGVRETLLKKGVFADKISVEPVPVEKKYFVKKDKGESKQNLGFRPERNLTLLCVNKKNYRELIDFAAMNTAFSDYAVMTKEGDVKLYAESKKISSFDSRINDEEVFNACDIVVSAFDGGLIKRVSARDKCVIVYGKSGKEEQTVANLEAGQHTKRAQDVEALGKVLMRFYSGELFLTPDETDENSAERIAEKMKVLLKNGFVLQEEIPPALPESGEVEEEIPPEEEDFSPETEVENIGSDTEE